MADLGAWTIAGSRALLAKDRRRLRLFGNLRFVRPAGKDWMAVEDAIQVEHDTETEAFTVRFGEHWIRLAPQSRAALAQGLSNRLVRSRHFGWQLEAGRAPQQLSFIVTHSPGVVADGRGWWFGSQDRIDLGLSLADWQSRFAGTIERAGNTISLDLRSAKGEGGTIDLDPDPVAITWARYSKAGPDELSVQQALAADSVFQGPGDAYASVSFEIGAAPAGSCSRLGVRFDGSPVAELADRIERVDLYLSMASTYSASKASELRVARVSFDPDILALGNYRAIYDGYSAGPVLSGLPQATGTWGVMDVTSIFEAVNPFELGLVSEYDVFGSFDYHSSITFAFWDVTGPPDADSPYLEVTLENPLPGGMEARWLRTPGVRGSRWW